VIECISVSLVSVSGYHKNDLSGANPQWICEGKKVKLWNVLGLECCNAVWVLLVAKGRHGCLVSARLCS